jgi:cyclic pyranopterin phosphate synthase
MVDVSGKPTTTRAAVARGRVLMSPEALAALQGGRLVKGDAFAVARVAGIMAAKQTPNLIPLCHGLPLSFVGVRFACVASPPSVVVEVTCRTAAQTGVEMEAIIGAQVAAATLYDMLKAIDKRVVISDIHLAQKQGGKLGDLRNPYPIPGLTDEAAWI